MKYSAVAFKLIPLSQMCACRFGLPITWFVAMHPIEFQISSGCRYLGANDLAPGDSTYNSIREHDDAQQRTTDSRAIPRCFHWPDYLWSENTKSRFQQTG